MFLPHISAGQHADNFFEIRRVFIFKHRGFKSLLKYQELITVKYD